MRKAIHDPRRTVPSRERARERIERRARFREDTRESRSTTMIEDDQLILPEQGRGIVGEARARTISARTRIRAFSPIHRFAVDDVTLM